MALLKVRGGNINGSTKAAGYVWPKEIGQLAAGIYETIGRTPRWATWTAIIGRSEHELFAPLPRTILAMLTESTLWIVFGISAGLLALTFFVGTRQNSNVNMRIWGI